MKSKKKFLRTYFFQRSLFLMAGIWIFGCQSFIDMDKPLPSGSMLWKKSGANSDDIESAQKICGAELQQEIKEKAISRDVQRDFFDICMLRKGFTFVPQPQDYPNVCLHQTFKNSIGCKSVRNEFKVDL